MSEPTKPGQERCPDCGSTDRDLRLECDSQYCCGSWHERPAPVQQPAHDPALCICGEATMLPCPIHEPALVEQPAAQSAEEKLARVIWQKLPFMVGNPDEQVNAIAVLIREHRAETSAEPAGAREFTIEQVMQEFANFVSGYTELDDGRKPAYLRGILLDAILDYQENGPLCRAVEAYAAHVKADAASKLALEVEVHGRAVMQLLRTTEECSDLRAELTQLRDQLAEREPNHLTAAVNKKIDDLEANLAELHTELLAAKMYGSIQFNRAKKAEAEVTQLRECSANQEVTIREAFAGLDKLRTERDALRQALQKIADNYGGCHCTHSDANCCEREGEFCPHCDFGDRPTSSVWGGEMLRDVLAILGLAFASETLYRSLMYIGWQYDNSAACGAIAFVLTGIIYVIFRTEGIIE